MLFLNKSYMQIVLNPEVLEGHIVKILLAPNLNTGSLETTVACFYISYQIFAHK